MLKLCLALHLCHSVSGQGYAVDGDTLRVRGIAVRLAGIDAEELSEPHGYAAKRQLARILSAGLVTCQLGAASYKRYVGRCEVNAVDVGAQMVAAGYALDCARYSSGSYRPLEPKGARVFLLQKPYC